MSKDTCPTRPLAPATMVLLLASALITLTSCAHARDARDDWPEGSAMHTMYVVNEQLQISRAALNEAHARLLTALDDNADPPSPLARAVASQHQKWLAYRSIDCELAGALTGAGGAWPGVHGLTCQTEQISQRLEVVNSASACLRALPPDGPGYEQLQCLNGLVDWAMQDPS